MQQIQRQLQTDRFHVRFLQSTCYVHVHVQESLHCAAQLSLLDLQLRQQIDEPFERALIPIDPEEIHFAKIHNGLRYLTGPVEVAARTRVPRLPIAMHDRLQNRGERCDADAGGDQDGVLGSKDVTGRCAVRSIYVDLFYLCACTFRGFCRSVFIYQIDK